MSLNGRTTSGLLADRFGAPFLALRRVDRLLGHPTVRDNPAQTTFAWGRNRNKPGHTLDGFLLETAIHARKVHTFFGRAERVDKDELFDSPPRAGNVFTVGKISLGYIYDFARWKRSQWGVGGVGSLGLVPGALKPAYGSAPASFMLFARAKII